MRNARRARKVRTLAVGLVLTVTSATAHAATTGAGLLRVCRRAMVEGLLDGSRLSSVGAFLVGFVRATLEAITVALSPQ